MTTNQKKKSTTLQKTFEAIKDLLIKTKAQLDDPNSSLTRPSLLQHLHEVAALAESLGEQRPRPANKDWLQLADTLDQEGVNLWNISGVLRKSPEDDGVKIAVGALRLAAFRLVEAGLEAKPGIESLLHVLQLASKTGATLSDLGKNDVAASVLTSAAKFEVDLRQADDPDGRHRQARACATVVYFSSRMEAAWKENNWTVAEYMSRKITDDEEQRLVLLPAHDRVLLASKFRAIGKSMLKDRGDGPKASDAVTWLQKGFSIVDKLEDSSVPGVPQLKISILRTLARAYFLSGAFDRAEAALEEIIPTIDTSDDHASTEYQELRWLRLAILKRRKAGEPTILDAFKSIVDHMVFSEASVTDVLQDLRTFSHQQTLVTAVNQHCLQRALVPGGGGGGEYVERLLLSLIVHSSKDQDHRRAVQVIDAAFTSASEADFELTKVPATACLSLLWQYGDRHYRAKKWSEAADCFLVGCHQIFRPSLPTSESKCYRKAALCYIEQREYARASAVIRRCPRNEASTLYVMFLAAVQQGLDEEAITAVQAMVKAPDFDRKMLMLATQISHESDMKTVLLVVLQQLLKTLNVANSNEIVQEAMALLRCIIRLAQKLLDEPAANKPVLIETVVSHYQTAKVLVYAACEQKAISLIMKDVSWLWRTAYNGAVQGSREWEGSEEHVSALFDVARDLLEACCQASPIDVDGDLYLHLINASFCGVSGRVFAARQLIAASDVVDPSIIQCITDEIKRCKVRITEILEQNKIPDGSDDASRVEFCLHTLRVFEAELLAYLKAWDQLSMVVGEAVVSGPMAVETYEAIADILWAEKDCPSDVLYGGLETILRASLSHGSLSVDKFSRWLRGICTIILARNDSGDRQKAIGYVEQALGVMEENNAAENEQDMYPMDERFWLLATTYNTGFECLEASNLDEAKRWFESATIICRFVPGGKERAEKISETYTQLLSRYSHS